MTLLYDTLRSSTIGDAREFGGLTMTPLTGSSAPEADYLVLDEALATGGFKISEVSDAGVVPTLRATNNCDRAVFLLEGEELVGAKQNRVLNLSLLVPAGATIDIPVSCVESGRWRRRSSEFSTSGNTQFLFGRARKVAQVSHSLREGLGARSDQSDVWAQIDHKLARYSIESETAAMSAVFEDRRDQIGAYGEALQPIADQVGAIFSVGGAVVGMEMFDSAATYVKLHRKLIAGYAADALENRQPAAPTDPGAVAEFVDRATCASTSTFEVAGVGRSVRLASPELAGAALELAGRIVHFSAFALRPGENGQRSAW